MSPGYFLAAASTTDNNLCVADKNISVPTDGLQAGPKRVLSWDGIDVEQ